MTFRYASRRPGSRSTSSKNRRLKLKVFQLHYSGLSWDEAAKELKLPRPLVRKWSREPIRSLATRDRQQQRNGNGQFVGRDEKDENTRKPL